MHNTKHSKDLLKKAAVAVLLVVVMAGVSFLVANLVHKNNTVQTSSIKNGLSAYELAVQQGFSGSLDDWLLSLQGKSAYQIAVDNGYSGSEKDWTNTLTAMSEKEKSDISSASFSESGELVVTMTDNSITNLGNIKGEKGDKGDTGENGKDGITPKIRINSLTLEWEVSNDNGQTWVSTNVKAVQAGNQETVGDFVYVLLENGTYGIRVSENFNSDSLEIPEKYNGISVTKIIDNGFKNKTNLTQIMLPNSIEIIGRHAFEGCTSLSSITIPDSVTTIGAYSFYKSGITEVNLSEIDKWVCDKDGMSYRNFYYRSINLGAEVNENYVSIDLSTPIM